MTAPLIGPSGFAEPAQALHAKHGFAECAPFGAYRIDPHSTFMTLALTAQPAR